MDDLIPKKEKVLLMLDLIPIKEKVLLMLNKLSSKKDYTESENIYRNEGLADWLDFLKSKGVFPTNEVFILVKYHCNLYSLDDENYYEDNNDFINEVFNKIKP